MPTLPRRCSLALLFALTACGGEKGQSTSDSSTTDNATTDPVGGSTTSGASVSSTVPTSDPTLDPPTTTASTGVMPDTSVSETSTSVGTSGEPACEFDIPTPGRCNEGPPKPATPRATIRITTAAPPAAKVPGPAVIVDDPDAVFASTGNEFIIEPDVGGGTIECDLFGDDCGPGQKCNAWANDGSSWNATKCVPVVPNPDAIGDPCTVDGSKLSGLDSCAKGAMCWNVDDNNMGHCVEQCGCSVENPICTTQATQCLFANDGVLALCVTVCDPLDANACLTGEICVPNGGGAPLCVIDASGAAGGVGDPCEFLNACDPGMLCAANNGQCDGAGCCTPFCDLDGPVCPGGTDCVAFFEQPNVPKCFEDLGVCFSQ